MDLSTIYSALVEQISALHYAEIISVVTAIFYLILAARENVWCWFFGIISCTFWAWAAFSLYDLYIDSLLQVFYVVISFWGIYSWKFGGKAKTELPITKLSLQEHGTIIGAGLVLSGLFGWLFAEYTSAASTYPDALTTVFSVLTTFMVIRKKLENWFYWLVIDSIYVWLYWSRGGYLFSLLFVVYLIIVVKGYLDWKEKYEAEGMKKGSSAV